MRATETKLATLHEAVAQVLQAQISHQVPEVEFDEDGMHINTGRMIYDASPATVSAAIKFLKDNMITCDVETSTDMSSLRDTLNKKQKHSRVDPTEAAMRLVT